MAWLAAGVDADILSATCAHSRFDLVAGAFRNTIQTDVEELTMVIEIGTDLQAALREQASRRGVTIEELAVQTLRDQFLPKPPIEPRDDWERRVLSIGSDCGVALSDEALSSEGLYD